MAVFKTAQICHTVTVMRAGCAGRGRREICQHGECVCVCETSSVRVGSRFERAEFN